MPKILSDTIINGTLNVQNVEHNGDNVRIVVSDQSGKFYYFDVASSAYKKKHFLSFYQEDILSPKQLDFKLLDPGDLNLSSAFRLIGSPNDLLNSQEIELGEGLAFENNKLVSTVTGGGSADTYYYYSGESMQPFPTNPGSAIANGNSAYIYLY